MGDSEDASISGRQGRCSRPQAIQLENWGSTKFECMFGIRATGCTRVPASRAKYNLGGPRQHEDESRSTLSQRREKRGRGIVSRVRTLLEFHFPESSVILPLEIITISHPRLHLFPVNVVKIW